jgi:glycosyltransferase involved in cell wall biosynthesis
MKIAYTMSRFPKLTETFVLYEIVALESLGVEVEIYPLLRERQSVEHPEAERLTRGAHYHPFVSFPILRANLHYLVRKPGAYLRVLAEVLAGTRRSRNFLVGALGIFPKSVRFAWEMERAGVDHLHAHFATHPALAALVVHRLTGIPFSFTAHGSDLHVDRTMLDRKIAASRFTVTVSRFNREVIVRECGEWAREKIRVVRCGVDPEVFRPGFRRRDAGEPLRILCVASYEEVKGHRYLIEACRLLKARGVRFSCHLVGDGPRRGEVEEQIARAGLRSEVIVHGPLPRRHVADLLSLGDMAALPSVPTKDGKKEGIPVALMEAMACALPVVSSDLSGIPELVEDGRTGLLVAPRDAEALAGALGRLAADPELRDRMGRAGRAKVLEEFHLERNAASLARLFTGAGEDGARRPVDRVAVGGA